MKSMPVLSSRNKNELSGSNRYTTYYLLEMKELENWLSVWVSYLFYIIKHKMIVQKRSRDFLFIMINSAACVQYIPLFTDKRYIRISILTFAFSLCVFALCYFILTFCYLVWVLCCSKCLFLYGPCCHSAVKLDLSTLFTTLFLWTSL